ncbi:MAG: hypothetical protein AB7O38_08630 [Pirellulaceae bacterium]
MREAELPDGTILEFPDGTPDEVMDRAVKKEMGLMPRADARPEPKPDPAADERMMIEINQGTRDGVDPAADRTQPGVKIIPKDLIPADQLRPDMTGPSGPRPGVFDVDHSGYRMKLKQLPNGDYELLDAEQLQAPEQQKQSTLGRLGDAALRGINRMLPDQSDMPLDANQAAIWALKNPGRAAQSTLGTVAAPFNALGPLAGQVATEFGADPGMSKRLSRDVDAALQVSAVPGTAGIRPISLAPKGISNATVQTARDFAQTGTKPMVGDITGGLALRTADATSSFLPGGYTASRWRARTNTDALSKKVDDVIGRLTPEGVSAATVGQGVQTGAEVWVNRFRGQAKKLYDEIRLDPEMPASTLNTTTALQKLIAPVPGAERTSEILLNPKVKSIADAFLADTAGTVPGATKMLPFETLKDLRTRVGELIATKDIVVDVPRAQLKKLYGALSDDMREAAKAAGQERQFDRANKFWQLGMERIEKTIQKTADANWPEQITAAIQNASKQRPTELANLMSSLQPEQRRQIAAYALRQIGKSDSKTTEEAFNIAKWATDWNKIPAETKDILFRGAKDIRADVEQIARVTDKLKSSSRVLAQPSGTVAGTTHSAAAFGAYQDWQETAKVLLIGLGWQATSRGIASATTNAVMASDKARQLVGNPTFLRWLSQGTRVNAQSLPGHVAKLAILAREMKPEDRAAVSEYLQAIKKQLAENKD